MMFMKVGFEFMVLDRKNTSIAGKEMIRHLENCKKYAEEHDAPCFLISVAMMPSSGDMSPQAQKVG
jgi:orotidine-5'-phosphate decarboxylase